MTEKIKEILYEADIKDVGFCSFDDIKDHLLECRALSRIPKNAKSVIVNTISQTAGQDWYCTSAHSHINSLGNWDGWMTRVLYPDGGVLKALANTSVAINVMWFE